eukprot:TRINITY_DN11134_c0_g1_i1.p2 TRINITY_DN11134_c0_g1~~TRINITY_DN11134_c0_g1_i1.p2  ORF type:complete len:122 (-),score=0.54 TRINITY_DN11134_c0_g1_i1:6-371(-)
MVLGLLLNLLAALVAGDLGRLLHCGRLLAAACGLLLRICGRRGVLFRRTCGRSDVLERNALSHCTWKLPVGLRWLISAGHQSPPHLACTFSPFCGIHAIALPDSRRSATTVKNTTIKYRKL